MLIPHDFQIPCGLFWLLPTPHPIPSNQCLFPSHVITFKPCSAQLSITAKASQPYAPTQRVHGSIQSAGSPQPLLYILSHKYWTFPSYVAASLFVLPRKYHEGWGTDSSSCSSSMFTSCSRSPAQPEASRTVPGANDSQPRSKGQRTPVHMKPFLYFLRCSRRCQSRGPEIAHHLLPLPDCKTGASEGPTDAPLSSSFTSWNQEALQWALPQRHSKWKSRRSLLPALLEMEQGQSQSRMQADPS